MLLLPCTFSVFLHAVAPPRLPNVWGGASYGTVMKNSGQIFAFSGADGETCEGSGFVGLLLPQIDNETLGIQFLGGNAVLNLGFSKSQFGPPNFLVVSSDVFVANSTDNAEQIVLAYKQWNVLVGRSPAHLLTQKFAKSPLQSPVCNISGIWETDGKVYTIVEDRVGIFSAHAKHPRSWRTASGRVMANGSMSITFDNRFQDTAILSAECDKIEWTSGHSQWIRVSPAPAGCSQMGQMALCAANNSQTFVAAYGPDAVDLASKTLGELGAHGVDDVVTARQAPFQTIPKPLMKSTEYDFARLANKVYSVMRVNTLSPEGIVPVHWSTPDKTPHQAMWLWDSCFHAIGRAVTEPKLAWEFLVAMLDSSATDGHIPIQSEPWSGALSGDTQPPLLTLATAYVYEAGGVNASQLQWALPRLARYIEWDVSNRDAKGNGLLEWHRGTESGLDNSPVFDHGSGLASTDFSVYVALEMSLLAALHTNLGNTSGASYWQARANRTRDKIHASLWDERDQFYYYREQAGDGDFVRVMTVSGFAPLLLDGMSADRVRALIKHIQDPNEFNTPAPLPTVAVKDASYSTNMWRGPAWTNTNWFAILGLRRYQHLVPEAGALADTLQQQTVDMVAKWYERFGTTFEFYDSADKTPPTTLERKRSSNSGGVRDYHWTAANTFWMLHNPTGTLPRMILG